MKRSMSFSLDGLEFSRMKLEGITKETDRAQRHTGQDALSILTQPGKMVILLFFISILLRRHQGQPP